ncbi:MerR family transcriptional regulator, partial [Cellulosilyticum ruminicola]|uniref:MerR family transcriptional regulator n=1 Tax=Cellulosilyticum ruminicola TaxID=425254 RepID=UPI0006D1D9CC
MLKIGEFSKLSLLTIKTLRYYEKEGLLIPTATDEYTKYRYYKVSQLQTAARIKAYRAMKLSIEEIKAIFAGAPEEKILLAKVQQLKNEQQEIAACLSKINYILEGQKMKYEAEIKNIPGAIVYYTEKRLAKIQDKMEFIPWCGAQCLKLNPDLQAANPEYEFIEYLEDAYK